MDVYIMAFVIFAVLVGTFFSVVSVLGYIRLPDVYTRLHTTGKISVFGVICLLLAAAVWAPVTWGHVLVLIFFILVAGPPTAHAVGSAAHRIGLPRVNVVRDDLAEKKGRSLATLKDEA